ncbi:MAG: DNA repair exonuclease [Candidatus Altiarchaeota archaeon]
MNIACISDCHIGYRHRFKTQRLWDYVSSFHDALEKSLERKPDIIVFGGDILHHSRPDPVSLRAVVRKLIEVADKTPVVVSIGNHEIEGHLGTAYAPIYSDLHENIHVLTSENPHATVRLKDGKADFYGFEYVRNRERVEDMLLKMSEGVNTRGANILLLHQAVEHYLEPHELSISALREVAGKYDLILLGHVHKHQRVVEVSDITPCYYIGSTERISFNEASNPTGILFFKNDFSNPEHVRVKSASMRHVRERMGEAAPGDVNRRVEDLLESNRKVKLLRVDVDVEFQGDLTEVRRDWSAYEGEHTILEVSVNQPQVSDQIALERITFDEDMIREYFEKSGIRDKELEELCVRLYGKYSVGS